MRNRIIKEDLQNITSLSLPWRSFEGKTILVTGANGLVPAYVVETLLFLNETLFHEKTKIIALVRNRDKALRRFAAYEGRTDLDLLVQDACQPIKINGDLNFIIHGASQASPKYYGLDPVGTLLPNVVGTANLLELAREKNVASFLFISGGEVYGNLPANQIPTKETDYGTVDPLNVRSCYGEGKRMGENMCACWHHQYKVPAKIVRLYHTYGPGLRLDDGRVFADFVSDIVNKRDIVMKSDGSARRAFCYLADVTAGIFTVFLNGSSGEAYNLGNEREEISILELADKLVSLFPERGLKVVRDEKAVQKGYLQSKISRAVPDTTKMRSLGWEPKTSIADGFSRTIRSFL